MDFVHLHVHTEYSLLDGSGKIKKLVKRAKELGMKSLAITDHGVMYGAIDFYKAAKDAGIKPIIGCEIYIVKKSMNLKAVDNENETHHLVLLCKNEVGYSNLMKIVSSASIEGFYYKPRIDHEFLKAHSEGLIASSACLGGEVQSHLLKDSYEKAKESALFYKEIFGDDFYLELQDHGIEEQRKVNKLLLNLSKDTNIPLIATNDVHYIEKEDYISHDVLLCIQTGKNVEDPNRMKYEPAQFYLRSPEEMYELFKYVPEALENTVKIAEKCNFDFEFHVSKLPKFPLPDGVEPFEYFRKVCYDGLNRLYDNVTEELIERLEYELKVMNDMGYVDYFLIVWDFIRFANESEIPTGPGRGSAAGSLVAYCLGITKIDPIKYGLIFERFLNPERVSMPDIDSDFCYERRGEVIDYVVEKYGSESVSQIITFGTMAARACIRDVGRALAYSYADVDKIAKMIPNMLGITIEKALDINPELKNAYDIDERVKHLIDISKKLEGLPRHSSTHAAGVVIASQPLVNYVPLQKNEDMIVTQFTMGTLEELGLLKMDFLGLRTLTVLKDAVKIIKQKKNIDIDLDKIDYADSNVYKMIGEGKTVGIFQLESAGMTSFMKDLKPDTIEDIIAGISLYRPGPMNEIPRYIEGKRNRDSVHYETPQLEEILDVTYGVMVYQEQVMEIVRKLAGYSLGRSDLVRRAMSKKKHSEMEKERKNFIYGISDDDGNIIVPGCIRNGISEEAATKIYDQMMDFASYAFNKSHAAAYAVVGYQTAYLMCYYPAEYIAALLNSVMGNSDKVAYYIRFAQSIGIRVLPPNINESYPKFTVKDDKTIVFGMAAIKNIGYNVIESIVKTREENSEFKSLHDFCSKVDISVINKRVVESLIKSGSLDGLGAFRSQMLAVYEKMLDGISNDKKKNIAGQINLFSLDEVKEEAKDISIQYPRVLEFQKKHILEMEKEMTGMYLTGHPLDEYEYTIKKKCSINTSHILEEREDDDTSKDGLKVILGGIITDVSRKFTRNNDLMAFITLEDLYSSIEVVIFPKTLSKNPSIVNADSIVLVEGRVSVREDEKPKIICENITPLIKIESESLYILFEDIDALKGNMATLKVKCNECSGNIPVYVCTKKERRKYMLDKEFWIRREVYFLEELKKIYGEENIKVLQNE